MMHSVSAVVPVAMLLRVDTISLTTPGLVSAVLYRAAINELTYQLLPHEGFLCQPVASLPSGLLDITDMQLEYSLVSKVRGDGLSDWS